MNNFKLIADNIDVEQIYKKLVNESQWNKLDFRKRSVYSAHRQVDDIILRFDSVQNYTNGMICIDYPSMQYFGDEIAELISCIKQKTNSNQVGRCIITKLRPNKVVEKHIDTEESARYYRRYHICIRGQVGNLFFCDNESTEMLTGQLWWFNNQKPHWCINSSEVDRIHLIVDMI